MVEIRRLFLHKTFKVFLGTDVGFGAGRKSAPERLCWASLSSDKMNLISRKSVTGNKDKQHRHFSLCADRKSEHTSDKHNTPAAKHAYIISPPEWVVLCAGGEILHAHTQTRARARTHTHKRRAAGGIIGCSCSRCHQTFPRLTSSLPNAGCSFDRRCIYTTCFPSSSIFTARAGQTNKQTNQQTRVRCW